MNTPERIALLAELGHYIESGGDEALESAIRLSYRDNPWFTPDNCQKALQAIAAGLLQSEALEAWVNTYPVHNHRHPERNIGLVMAGNIPLVGFHDWLCVFAAGHRAVVKLSDKDKHLLPLLVRKMGEWQRESLAYTLFLTEGELLRDFDAVIATGSNNTSRYFEQYFPNTRILFAAIATA